MDSFVAVLTKTRQIASVVRLTPFDDATPEGRSQERYRRVALTSLAAILARGVGTLTSLVSVPLTLHYLGIERYGLWMTISSTIALLGFSDLGMGNGLLNAISEANGQDDTASAQMYVSSAFFLLFGIAILILGAFAGIFNLVPWARVFNVTSPLAIDEAGPATLILVLGFVVNMPLGIVQRVQMGYQEGFRTQLWTAVGALLGLVGVLLAVHLEAGLPWLVLMMSGGPTLAILGNWLDFFGRSRRWLLPQWQRFNWKASRKVASLGFVFLILQLLALISNTSDNLVIAQVLGAAAVASYAVTQKIFSITLIAQYFLAPLWPAFGEAMARNDKAWVRRTLKRSLVLSLGLGLVTGLPLLFFGKQIISLWTGSIVEPSFFLLLGFTFWILVNCYIGSISTFLNSGNLVAKQVPFFGLAAITALALKIVGAQYLQTEGVVWATVIGFGLFYIVPSLRIAFVALKRDDI